MNECTVAQFFRHIYSLVDTYTVARKGRERNSSLEIVSLGQRDICIYKDCVFYTDNKGTIPAFTCCDNY